MSSTPRGPTDLAPKHRIDPSLASRDYGLVIMFPKSRASSYAAAVAAAKLASLYEEIEVDGKVATHVCAFAKNQQQMSLALMVTNWVGNLKGVQAYASGRILSSPHSVSAVLDCYLTSLTCTDWRAHCDVIVSDPFKRDEFSGVSLTVNAFGEIGGLDDSVEEKYLHPCRLVHDRRWSRHALSEEHPASAADQIQAHAASINCEWCPNFHPEDFRKLDAREMAPPAG